MLRERRTDLRNGKDRLFICAGYAGTAALFLLGVCYIFAALGLFSFGVVSVPCILLGKIGMLTVISAPAGHDLRRSASGGARHEPRDNTAVHKLLRRLHKICEICRDTQGKNVQ